MSDAESAESVLNYTYIRKASMILRALDHPLRQNIFNFLAEGNNPTVTDIIANFGLEQSVVSQHLAILRRAKIIYSLRNGKFVHYYVNEERVGEIQIFLDSLLKETRPTKVIELEKESVQKDSYE